MEISKDAGVLRSGVRERGIDRLGEHLFGQQRLWIVEAVHGKGHRQVVGPEMMRPRKRKAGRASRRGREERESGEHGEVGARRLQVVSRVR